MKDIKYVMEKAGLGMSKVLCAGKLLSDPSSGEQCISPCGQLNRSDSRCASEKERNAPLK